MEVFRFRPTRESCGCQPSDDLMRFLLKGGASFPLTQSLLPLEDGQDPHLLRRIEEEWEEMRKGGKVTCF